MTAAVLSGSGLLKIMLSALRARWRAKITNSAVLSDETTKALPKLNSQELPKAAAVLRRRSGLLKIMLSALRDGGWRAGEDYKQRGAER